MNLFSSKNIKLTCENSISRSVISDSLQPHGLQRQAPLSLEFSRQEYRSGLLLLSPGELPNPGTEPVSHVSCIGKQALYIGNPIYMCMCVHTHTHTHIYIHMSECIIKCVSATGESLCLHTHTQREKKRESYFKGLDHAVMEAGESKIHRVVWQPGDPGKRHRCNVSPKVMCRQKSFLLRGSQSFVLSTLSAD